MNSGWSGNRSEGWKVDGVSMNYLKHKKVESPQKSTSEKNICKVIEKLLNDLSFGWGKTKRKKVR